MVAAVAGTFVGLAPVAGVFADAAVDAAGAVVAGTLPAAVLPTAVVAGVLVG